MVEFHPSNFTNMTAQEFADVVKATKDSTIEEVMRGEHRTAILDQVFHRFPGQFRPEKAGSNTIVAHWIITGRPDGGNDTYEVIVENGTCTVSEAPHREPRISLMLAPLHFLKIASGANPVMMFMTGKLKATGDLGVAANIANLFDMPKG
jgi:hypothetical protein